MPFRHLSGWMVSGGESDVLNYVNESFVIWMGEEVG